jgi:hypothetical protein
LKHGRSFREDIGPRDRREKFSGVFMAIEKSMEIAGVYVQLSNEDHVLEMTEAPSVMY